MNHIQDCLGMNHIMALLIKAGGFGFGSRGSECHDSKQGIHIQTFGRFHHKVVLITAAISTQSCIIFLLYWRLERSKFIQPNRESPWTQEAVHLIFPSSPSWQLTLFFPLFPVTYTHTHGEHRQHKWICRSSMLHDQMPLEHKYLFTSSHINIDAKTELFLLCLIWVIAEALKWTVSAFLRILAALSSFRSRSRGLLFVDGL